MILAELDDLLKALSEFLAAHQGKKPAAEFEEFRKALQPFRDLTLAQFSSVLNQRAEAPIAPPARRAPAKRAAVPKKSLKSSADQESVQTALAQLHQLYENSLTTELSYPDIDSAVSKLAAEFDAGGLKAIAQGFGIRTGLKSKEDSRRRIADKIKDRKNQSERAARVQEESQIKVTDVAPTESNIPLFSL